MKKKVIMISTLLLVAIFITTNFGISNYFYKLAIERGPKDFLQGNQDLEVSAETLEHFLEGDWITWTQEQPFETWDMKAFDGIDLKGYYLEAESPSNKIAVFAHGYLGHAFDMGLFGEYYYKSLGFLLLTYVGTVKVEVNISGSDGTTVSI